MPAREPDGVRYSDTDVSILGEIIYNIRKLTNTRTPNDPPNFLSRITQTFFTSYTHLLAWMVIISMLLMTDCAIKELLLIIECVLLLLILLFVDVNKERAAVEDHPARFPHHSFIVRCINNAFTSERTLFVRPLFLTLHVFSAEASPCPCR